MPSPRYTVRLPPALDAQVQARVRAGPPFAVLIREALSAYLADTAPTGAPTHPLTPADSADSLQTLGEQLVLLRARVDALEQALTPRRQGADSPADTRRHGAACDVDRSAPRRAPRHHAGADSDPAARPSRRPHCHGNQGLSWDRKAYRGCPAGDGAATARGAAGAQANCALLRTRSPVRDCSRRAGGPRADTGEWSYSRFRLRARICTLGSPTLRYARTSGWSAL